MLRDLADPAAAGELLVEPPRRPAVGGRPADPGEPPARPRGGGRRRPARRRQRERAPRRPARRGRLRGGGRGGSCPRRCPRPASRSRRCRSRPAWCSTSRSRRTGAGCRRAERLLTGSVALGAVGEPAIVSAAAGPATIGAGVHWAVVRCRAGAAVWLAAAAGADSRTARDAGGGWVAGAALPALAPAFELLARAADGDDVAAATALRVGGAVVAAERDGDRATYPLAGTPRRRAGRRTGRRPRPRPRGLHGNRPGHDRRLTAPDRLRPLKTAQFPKRIHVRCREAEDSSPFQVSAATHRCARLLVHVVLRPRDRFAASHVVVAESYHLRTVTKPPARRARSWPRTVPQARSVRAPPRS